MVPRSDKLQTCSTARDLARETNRAVKGIGAVPGGPSHFHKYSKYLKTTGFELFNTSPPPHLTFEFEIEVWGPFGLNTSLYYIYFV